MIGIELDIFGGRLNPLWRTVADAVDFLSTTGR